MPLREAAAVAALRPVASTCGVRGRGFTVVELMVTIAIILILATLLFPALASGKERARRAVCLNNLRGFSLALHFYAGDTNDLLPPGYSDYGERTLINMRRNGTLEDSITVEEHTPVLARSTRLNLIRYAEGHNKILVCPGMGSPFSDPGGFYYQNCGIIIGYHYLGGHRGTPWREVMFPTITNQWISPRKLSDDPQSLIAADLNAWARSRVATFVPHAARGSKIVGGERMGLKPTMPFPLPARTTADFHPARFGAKGGNQICLDGSARWKPIRHMNVYIGSRIWPETSAYGVW